MPCLVSQVSQRVLLICGGTQGWLILLLITDKLQNQVSPQPPKEKEEFAKTFKKLPNCQLTMWTQLVDLKKEKKKEVLSSLLIAFNN